MPLIDVNRISSFSNQCTALEHSFLVKQHLENTSYKLDRADAEVQINGKLGGPRRRDMKSVTGMLERIGCGYLVLDHYKRVIEWNGAAQGTFERQGEVADTANKLTTAMRRLVANVPGNFPTGSLSWVVIRRGGDEPMILSEEGTIASNGTCIIALLDRESQSAANPQTLQKMFGLTSAETHLALRLAQGDAPLEIAHSWHLSRTTIRSQLASLFAKTYTKRQAELVALLGRISVLP